MNTLQLLDWIILATFFVGIFGVVIWVSRLKEETSSDYFLAGRNATWLAIGASIFSSNIGSEHLVGLAGAGAESGMAMAHFEIQAWMILVLGWVFVPFYARSKVFTMPEFLERRYNSKSRTFLSVISLVSYILTKISVTVYAGGIVFKTVMGIDSIFGIDFFWIGSIGLVLITGFITILGGMKAVLYTSVIQTPILIIGSLLIVFIGLSKLGGWGELERIVGDNMHLMRPANDPKFPWPGMLLGSAIIGFWYWCTDQYIVQRTLSAKNQTHARRGAIFAGYLKLLPVFLFLIPGMIAFALNQKGLIDLKSSDQSYLTLVTHILPVGVRGLVVVGLLSALICSLSSKFNSTATLFTIDFYKKFRPETPEKKLVLVGRLATAAIVVLGILWIPIMKLIANVLYEYLQNVQSLIAPAIAAVFFTGVFWKRITAQGGLWGLIIGFIIGMFRLVLVIFVNKLNPDGFLYQIATLNWLYFCTLLFAFCVLLIFVISYFTKRPSDAQIEGLTMVSATPEQKAETKKSYNNWDIVNSVVILLLVIAFYIYFW